MNLFSSRVKARLYKKGYQGFTKDDYAEAALDIGLIDENNPTKEELEKAVSHLINKQTYQLTETDEEVTKTLSQQENTTLYKQIQDETKGEITFTNNFEKAGAIQEAFTASGIEVSDIEVMGISGDIENKFSDHKTFIVSALKAWRNYQIQNGEQQADEIQGILADIRTDAANFTNRTNASMTATANYINGLRAKQREEFLAFIERVKTN